MRTRMMTVAAIGALLTVGTATSATAAPRPLVDLSGQGVGSYVLDAAGAAHLSGSVAGVPFDGSYTATLASSDGSLPAPGECEPAVAGIEVAGSRDRTLRLDATGEVCGEWVDATYVVTHRFVGRYVVVESSTRRLHGTDGWTSLILATEGRANLEAIDT